MIKKAYRRILDPTGSQVLDDAEKLIPLTWERYRNHEISTWGYEIPADRPLRFIHSQAGRLNLQVDIYCNIQWSDKDVPVKQDLKLRLWSKKVGFMFRPAFDAPHLEEVLENTPRGRVMSRFHFDRVDHSEGGGRSNQYHPHFHMQIGGIQDGEEYCWYPNIDIPRVPHHPMELFLMCQTVAVNFFPEYYETLKTKQEWIRELLVYQDKLLKPYYRKSLEILETNSCLLDELIKPFDALDPEEQKKRN